ncbi:hypothetical protein FAM09_10775 [Niastella caeni]|uniref:Uncharacterized protein n=1 Tax=Niastella caeni TaxID=2569763 RepID=A0A4S8HX99_9BACT|nr:hypothetical protein [Niastella caeni]THU40343.1 hypothetical protein FAM09_10775 [Niastella caeni]
MQLKKGIRLSSDLSDMADQVTINDGTMVPTENSGLSYLSGSYIPKTSWRKLHDKESSLLFTHSKKADFRKSIFVGNIPSQLKASFEELNLHACTSVDQILPAFGNKEEEVKQINKSMHAFLKNCSSTSNYKFHRITRALPNRDTTTCHYVREKFIYVGLHIDQSRKFTPYTAYKSGNRISINLGRETRHLAFINLSMLQVVKMIRECTGLSDASIDCNNIGYLFFKHFPEYPVVKLALKPYQYYIAPTDNFFHDATTLGKNEIDVTIVYTGLFDMAG